MKTPEDGPRTGGPFVQDPLNQGVELSAPEDVADISQVPAPSSVELHHARTAATLAYLFAAFLLLMFLLNLGVVFWLSRSLKAEESLEAVAHVFSTWVPIFAASVSSAVTYYFTQNKRH